MKTLTRCSWANSNELFIPYHDKEWGVPVHNDRLLFEMLNLESAQAGLSWLTILKKRAAYKKAFDNFDAKKIVKYNAAKKLALMKNPGIVRNRLKIAAVIKNARGFLEVKKEFGTFNSYLWAYVNNKPLPHKNRAQALKLGEQISKDLKSKNFTFVGPTIIFAYLQAVGLLNDHSPDCFRAKEIERIKIWPQ
jgi:DNA-3-methyladenine glycosylase I